jgi:hypothetical protein
MPSGLPSQTMRQPRARRKSATARPGKHVPAGAAGHDEDGAPALAVPKPPPLHALCALGRPRISWRFSQSTAQQDRQRDAVGEDARAAEAHQRQRQALGRQQAHVDAHVDERLHADPDADALRHQRGEGALEQQRLAADGEGALTSQANSTITASTPTRPSSSAITASRKSVCASGQVEQLLDARAEADAEPLAAAEGDQRVRQLVALAVGDPTTGP